MTWDEWARHDAVGLAERVPDGDRRQISRALVLRRMPPFLDPGEPDDLVLRAVRKGLQDFAIGADGGGRGMPHSRDADRVGVGAQSAGMKDVPVAASIQDFRSAR